MVVWEGVREAVLELELLDASPAGMTCTKCQWSWALGRSTLNGRCGHDIECPWNVTVTEC